MILEHRTEYPTLLILRFIKIYLTRTFHKENLLYLHVSMAKFAKVILLLLLAIVSHNIAGKGSTVKVVDKQDPAIIYATEQQGEICVPDLFDRPVAELNNLQSHQLSVTRIQRVQLGEYFFSLKNVLQCCADRENSLSQHWGRIYDTTPSCHCQPSSEYYVYALRRILI